MWSLFLTFIIIPIIQLAIPNNGAHQNPVIINATLRIVIKVVRSAISKVNGFSIPKKFFILVIVL
jgi:hypothetical protein